MATGFKKATVTSGDVPATQTDFPSYIDLSRLGITTLAEAQSVRVYADSGKVTEWAREIVSATEMHVKVPSLTNTTTIYVDWDGVRADYAVGATYGRNAVWSDYLSVFHGNDLTTSTLTDSTGNSNGTKGAANQPNQITGKIAEGQDFGTTSNVWSFTNSPTLNTGDPHSWQMWIKPTSGTVSMQPAVLNATGFNNTTRDVAGVQTVNPSRVRYFTFAPGSTSAYLFYETTNTFTASSWNYIHVERNGTAIKIKINGNTPQSGTISTPRTFAVATQRHGYGYQLGSGNTPGEIYGGEQDEMRLRNGTLSDDWATTEYNNQDDEAGFWGTWTNAGGGGPVPTNFLMYF